MQAKLVEIDTYEPSALGRQGGIKVVDINLSHDPLCHMLFVRDILAVSGLSEWHDCFEN